MEQAYEKYINIYNSTEWAGLLYIHTFHALEFQSTLDESLQLFDEMLWVNEYQPSSMIQDNVHALVIKDDISRILAGIQWSNINWNDPVYTVGKKFIMEVMPEYHEKIDRALDRIKEKELLIAFYSESMETNPRQQERMQIYLEDDLSDYYSGWKPDPQD